MAGENETPEVDPFEAAFNELQLPPDEKTSTAAPAVGKEGETKAEGETKVEGVLPTAEQAAAEAAAAAAAGKEGEGKEPAKAGEGEGKEPAKEGEGKEPPKPPASLSNEQLLEGFRNLVATGGKAPETKTETAPAPITPYSAEEQKLIADYKAEWPDVYAAQEAMNKRLAQGIVAHMFDELRPVLQQLQGQTGQLSQQTHIQQLQARIPDYREITPKVVEWANAQPKFLKDAYDAVIKGGTVEDVVELVNVYRTATNTPVPKPALVPTGGAPAGGGAPPKPADAAKEKALKGLAPVQSKSSGVQTGGIAPDDFDGAFDTFADQVAKAERAKA